MLVPNKKLWIVTREVRANSPKEAMRTNGDIISVALADDKYQPEQIQKKRVGYGTTNKADS